MKGHAASHSSSDSDPDSSDVAAGQGPAALSTNGFLPYRQHARKVSSPLAPAFMVSAPGKVIVYGEHAVVHGKVG